MRSLPFTILVLLGLVTSAFAADSSDRTGACCAGSCLTYILIVLAINIAILAWVYSDAKKRGTTGIGWLAIVLIFGILGLIAYLVMRPQGKLETCPDCGKMRPITAAICPHCGKKTS